MHTAFPWMLLRKGAGRRGGTQDSHLRLRRAPSLGGRGPEESCLPAEGGTGTWGLPQGPGKNRTRLLSLEDYTMQRWSEVAA